MKLIETLVHMQGLIIEDRAGVEKFYTKCPECEELYGMKDAVQ
jgi:uncharacterized C2H2 Zn-finger protein